MAKLMIEVNKPYKLCVTLPLTITKSADYTQCHTVYDRMDAAATINFSVQSGAATIRERRLFESGVYFVQSGYRNSSQL